MVDRDELVKIAQVRLSKAQAQLLGRVGAVTEYAFEDRELRSLDVLTDYGLVTQGHGRGRRGARVTSRGQQWLRRNAP